MAAVPGPTFLGIGAQKTGTTWLHSMLRLHPDVGMPEQKELHFWDREEPDAASIEAYCARFDAGRARGEITPSYAILPPARIAAIHRRLPWLKLIYIVRDPVERAWSQARMEFSRHIQKHGASPADLDAWLDAQLRSPESLARGDYATCIVNWLAEYPREQLQVSIYEETMTAPRRFLQDCARHLGVDPAHYGGVTDAALAVPVYPEQTVLKIGRVELPEHARDAHQATLSELYAPRITALSTMLGRDCAALWLRD
jgi:hypothetical protein